MVTRIAYWGGGDGLGDRERGHCVGGMRCRVQEEEVSTAHYDDDNEKEEMDPITWERRPRRLRPNSNAAAPPKKKTIKIYIMSLAVRSPYRNVGVGSALINYLLELPGSIRVPSSYSNSADPDASTAFCIYSTPSLPPPPPVSTFIIPTASPAELKALKEAVEIEAAVWEDNEEAIEWYAKRGFDVNSGGVVRGYYKKLKPDGARLVRYRWVKGEGARRLLRPGARGRLSWI